MLTDRIEDYLRTLRYGKRYSPHTLEAYSSDLRQFVAYLEETAIVSDWTEVTHFAVRGWLAGLKGDKGFEPRTLNRKRSALAAFFQFLLREGVITTNPVRKGQSVKVPERLPEYLKESEAARLLDEIEFAPGFTGKTQRLVFELLYGCGLRRAELIGLQEADIGAGVIRVLGKGGKERMMPLSPKLGASIRDYVSEKKGLPKANRRYLLITDAGDPLYPGWVYVTVKKYLSLVCTLKKCSPHILRHSFATHLLAGGANIQAIRDLLGHSSLAATQVYTHTDFDALKEMHRKLHPRG
jgi:integrase/recombinase XerC